MPILDWFERRLFLIVYSVVVLCIGFLVFVINYDKPSGAFWDESYHVTSAEKYIQGVMFMELHPPLGKMFIALGEKLVNPNSNVDKSELVATDYISELPQGYSFRGVRLFPSIFAWLAGLLFFWIAYLIVKDYFVAFLFSGLYIFENAFVVHFRGAMLEGIQIFFLLASVLVFVWMWQKSIRSWQYYCLLGLTIGLTVATKINGLILVILPLYLAISELWDGRFFRNIFKQRDIDFSKILRLAGKLSGAALVGIFVYFSILQIHILSGQKIVDDKIYKASPEYIAAIENGKINTHLLVATNDNLTYFQNYNEGVPPLNIYDPNENGSYPVNWIVGNKAINYRWAKLDDSTAGYSYLVGNPINWAIGLMGLILAVSLILGKLVFNQKIVDKKLFYLSLVFILMYFGYMISVLQVDRVLYLYHYFIPLIFTYILIVCMYSYISTVYNLTKSPMDFKRNPLLVALCILWLASFATFLFFSPLSYSYPLTTSQFNQRIWFKHWMLKPTTI